MTEGARILVAEDDLFMAESFRQALGHRYRVEVVGNGLEALQAAQAVPPDLVLLDVAMPGLDGYETCRKLKESEASAAIPVIFVSGRDRIEDRILGYEAGGDDYIVKPFELPELEAKIALLLRSSAEYGKTREMADHAFRTAMTAMTSMGEMGVLLQSLQRFNSCADETELAGATVDALAQYELQCAVQIRSAQGVVSRSSHGEASPLQEAVIRHMKNMERIVQFKAHLSINYEHVSLLVSNLPLADVERCGRLRDHLAVLIEGAEVRALAIASATAEQRRASAIARISGQLSRTLAGIDAAQRQRRGATLLAVNAFTDQMERAYLSLGLSESQEHLLAAIVTQGVERILAAQADEVGMQDRLSGVIEELNGMSG